MFTVGVAKDPEHRSAPSLRASGTESTRKRRNVGTYEERENGLIRIVVAGLLKPALPT